MSVSLSVPEAAAALNISQRTVWRQIKDGRLRTVRDGRTVRVLLEPGAGRVHAVGEAGVAYGTKPVAEAEVGPWPFTAEKLAIQAERLRARRIAAVAELRRLALDVKPDPDGRSFMDYLRAEDEPPSDAEVP
jgi:excisionase family DNA binding protein